MEGGITLIRSARKTLSVTVTGQGEVIARAPLKMPRREIDAFLREKAGWISEKQEEARKRNARYAVLPPLTDADIAALKKAAAKDLKARAARLAPLAGVTYGHISIRCQSSRWGSCSAKGNLNFNCLLMLAPEAVRDSVVVHELCHRIEMNRSPRFDAEVRRVMPQYDACRKWLKENGSAIMARVRAGSDEPEEE